MNVNGVPHRTVRLRGQSLDLINQPLLPHRFEVLTTTHHTETARAISTMVVRGAGAIGATGAAGLAQAALEAPDEDFSAYLDAAQALLASTRPTAQNLFYGLDQVRAAIDTAPDLEASRAAAVAMAQQVADDDAERCRRIGQVGASLIVDGARVATHCNAGWLAFVDWGSALSPIYVAHRSGKHVKVWVNETRPRAQGARLTAWELGHEGIPHTVIADNSLGSLMRNRQVDLVITGADRIAANGDVANKIGTYAVAELARANGIPFFVAAPLTTIDVHTPTGADIPIEERSEDEVAYAWGWSDEGRYTRVRLAAPGSPCFNPAFDITPAPLITALITDKGVVPASAQGVRQALAST